MSPPSEPTVVKRRSKDLKPRQLARKKRPAEEVLRALGKSVMRRQLHPLLITADNTIIDGHCRKDGVDMIDPDHPLDCLVVSGDLTVAEASEMQLISAMHRTDLTCYEQASALHEWLELNPGATGRELAERIDRSPATVTKLVSLFKCPPETIKAAEDGKIALNAWYAISQLATAEEQNGLLTFHLEAGSATKRTARPPRPKAESRPARVTLPVSGDAKLVITAPVGDCSELVELLQGALELVRKATREHLSLASAQKVWADRAKAVV